MARIDYRCTIGANGCPPCEATYVAAPRPSPITVSRQLALAAWQTGQTADCSQGESEQAANERRAGAVGLLSATQGYRWRAVEAQHRQSAAAHIKKEGTAYDLPIAVGVFLASEQTPLESWRTLFLGELSVDDPLRHTAGILHMISLTQQRGTGTVFEHKRRATQSGL